MRFLALIRVGKSYQVGNQVFHQQVRQRIDRGPDARALELFGCADEAAFRAGRGPGAVLRGKFGYLSPEQVRGLPVDRRADVFSLGAVLHELLTGHRLFHGPSDLAVLERVRAAQVRPPSERNPAVPPALDAAVLRALSREPADRFPWASDLADALQPLADPDGRAALAHELAVRFPVELAEERARSARAAGLAAAP
jgi:serine/threonine-protein kinase